MAEKNEMRKENIQKAKEILSGGKLASLLADAGNLENGVKSLRKAFEDKLHKNLKGVYYFPLSNEYSKDELNYRFNGVTFKSKENILAIDKNLANYNYKSKVLNLTTGKSGEFYKSSYLDNMCLDIDELNYLLDFAINQVDKAIERIKLGDIHPFPIKQGQKIVCKYCDFKGLCNYTGDNDKVEVAIPSISDLKQKEDNNGGRA